MPRQTRSSAVDSPPISPLLLEEIEMAKQQYKMRIGFSYRRMAAWLAAVVLFFLFTSISLLFAFGYQVDWKRMTLTQTSVIELSGVQVEFNVEVYLNDEKIEGNQLPLRLSGLHAGKYDVQVKRAGSVTFEHSVMLHENERKRILGILLPTKTPIFADYTGSDASDRFLPSKADRENILIKNGNELWFDGSFIVRTSSDILDARHFGYKNFIAMVTGSEVVVVNPLDHDQQSILRLPEGTDQVSYEGLLQKVFVKRNSQIQVATVYEETPVYLRYLPVVHEASPKGN